MNHIFAENINQLLIENICLLIYQNKILMKILIELENILFAEVFIKIKIDQSMIKKMMPVKLV